jgi:thiamine-monophosphate kinase
MADGRAVLGSGSRPGPGSEVRPCPGSAGRGEREALARLNALIPGPPSGEVWFGDDAAAVALPPMPGPGGARPAGGRAPLLLLATDTVVAGIDADLSLTTLADLGWKAMAVNLSDIAAMGGTPGHALVSVVGLGPDDLNALYEGVLEAAETYRCPVVGGDLSAGAQPVVTVAVTGWVDGPPVLRSGARPGDTIWVTAPLGAAAAGLRLLRQGAAAGPPTGSGWSRAESDLVRAHARPRPALAEGTTARLAGATAMIDVSDGLIADLSRMAELSVVGFELRDIPLAPGATLDEALGGGDDYVLAFTMPGTPGPCGSSAFGPFSAAGLPAPYLVGKCLPDPAQRLMAGTTLAETGWEHPL